jgi:hypothetical protein
VQYPESVVRSLTPIHDTMANRHSADSRDSSPGRTAFFSWLLKVVCTYVQCKHLSFTYLTLLRNSLGSSRVFEQYGRHTYTQWKEHYVERTPSGPLPSAPFPGYIQVPLTFVINAFFFSIPKLYLEHIKEVSQYHGRLDTVQDIWDKYTRQIVKDYQDFLLVVRSTHPFWFPMKANAHMEGYRTSIVGVYVMPSSVHKYLIRLIEQLWAYFLYPTSDRSLELQGSFLSFLQWGA